MKFLLTQVVIVALICIFFAALSNLTEMGIVGWIIAGSTGHSLYRIYRHLNKNICSKDTRGKCSSCNSDEPDFSERLKSFMFDDATQLSDD